MIWPLWLFQQSYLWSLNNLCWCFSESGPKWLSKWIENFWQLWKYLRPELTSMAARLGVCNNKLNYSRVQLVSLKKYATSFLISLVITSLKQEGLLRNRGVRSGLKRRRKLWHMCRSISVITRPWRSKYDYHNRQTSVNGPRNAYNLITVKICKPSFTLP